MTELSIPLQDPLTKKPASSDLATTSTETTGLAPLERLVVKHLPHALYPLLEHLSHICVRLHHLYIVWGLEYEVDTP